MRGIIVVALALLSACDKKQDSDPDPWIGAPGTAAAAPTPTTFYCFQTPLAGGPWRECQPKRSKNCESLGCFERPEAYCFPIHVASFGSRPATTGTICAPSERECEEWNEDRKNVPNRSLGPCTIYKPDEYKHY